MNRLMAERGGPGRMPTLTETFRQATRLEIAFWNMGMAADGDRWYSPFTWALGDLTVEYSLYVVLAALLLLHWRAAAGRNLNQLFEADNHLQHQVHRVIAKHPAGGNWREHKAWMADDTG